MQDAENFVKCWNIFTVWFNPSEHLIVMTCYMVHTFFSCFEITFPRVANLQLTQEEQDVFTGVYTQMIYSRWNFII